MNLLHGVLLLLLLVCAQTSSASRHPPPPRPYNVLILSPIGTRSHQGVMMPIAVALADRGHQVTVLTGFETSSPRRNITVLTHSLKYTRTEHLDYFNMGRGYSEILLRLPVALANMSRDLYQTPEVADLYRRKDEFDVVIIDFFFNELVYPFAVGKPFITASLCCNDPIHSKSFGNMLNPAYFSHPLKHYRSPLSLWERIENLIITISLPFLRYWVTFVPVQYHISQQFPDLPSLEEIERNQSVAFVNTHFSVTSPREPLLPGQVEIGGIHCREGEPLPQDIMDFVSTDVPVVLMSFGATVSPKFMKESHKQMFLASFSKLPYRIILSFDGVLRNVPSNVMIKNWLPQQDIMAHPNVKLFITHGGTAGLLEAVYHATPMLVMPICSDQPKNAMRIQNLGIGLTLSWDDVSKERFTESITKIISDPQYETRILEMSAMFKDRPDTPSEQVVYWTEFAVRRGKKTPYHSPENDLNLIQLLHFDVFAVLCVSLYLCYKMTMLLTLPLVKNFLMLLKKKHISEHSLKKMD